MRLRTLLFWCHLTAGVTAGVVILVMSLTGVLLMYERQLIEWSDRGFRSAPRSAGTERLTVEALLARVARQREGTPSALTIRADPAAPAAVAFGQTTVYADAYTGQILGEPTTGVRSVMTALRSWHRWLAIDAEHRDTAKATTGWANLLFLFIVLSGLYLWIPRIWEWTRVRAVVFFRRGLRGKARDFNWHNTIGIWCAIPLALVVVTATPISFPWANALLYQIVGETPPAPATAPTAAPPRDQARPARSGLAEPGAAGRVEGLHVDIDDLDALWARAEAQVPGWRSINVRLPAPQSETVTFTIDRGNGGQPQARSTLTLDASGGVARWEPFESLSLGRRLRSWSRFTHTGEAFGFAGQTIAGIVSAGGVVLVWTGLSLAWRRFLGWSSRKGQRADADGLSTRRTEAA